MKHFYLSDRANPEVSVLVLTYKHSGKKTLGLGYLINKHKFVLISAIQGVPQGSILSQVQTFPGSQDGPFI